MKLTNEQIDAAIAALEAQRTKAAREWWVVLDNEGTSFSGLISSREYANEDLQQATRNGSFAPYELVRVCEVIA